MEAATHARAFEGSQGRQKAASLPAIFIVFAGLVHLFAAPQHLDHFGHALFLMLAGVSQVTWGLAFWRKPSVALYSLGVVLAGAFIVLWAITRVLPAPFGHGAGEVEVVGVISKVAEGAGFAGLLTMILLGAHSGGIRWPTWRVVLAPLTLAVIGAFALYGAGLVAERLFPWLGGEAHSAAEAGAVLPSAEVFQRLLTRSGLGATPGTFVSVTYAPPSLLRSMGEEAPPASLERPTAIFLLLEENSDHHAGFDPGPIKALLRLDKGEAIEPFEGAVLYDDGHGYRSSRLLFPLPSDLNPERLSREERTLILTIPQGSGEESVFRWDLPLALARGAPQSASLDEPTQVAVSPFPSLSIPLRNAQAGLGQQEIVQSLTRLGVRPEGAFFPNVEVVLVTREFVVSSGNHRLLETVTEPSLLFYLYEESHEELPSLPPEPLLGLVGTGVDRTPQAPAEVRVLTDSPHHRAVLVRYALAGPLIHLEHGMGERLELVFPALQGKAVVGNVLSWDLPIRYGPSSVVGSPVLRSSDGIATSRAVQGSSLSIAMVLGLFGGFLASMWPCLFQLTAYFIPSLAGISMGQAQSGNAAPALRRQVLKSALFFVLGIVIVYTAAGGIIGFAAQSLSGTTLFQTWQRPLSILAGLVLVVMAIRLAVQARAPLVCRMPIISHLGGTGPTGPVGSMILGLTFATGCMTCFGSAVVLGLVMYVVSSASMLTGAFLLFVFSLGISIPLVAAAVAMAQVLPLLGRLERLAPWMALVSSGIMITYAGLLISGQYHIFSTVIARMALRG